MKQPPQFHQVIFDSMHEGMYTVDKNFRIIGVNEAAEKLTGYTKSEILGKFCKNIFQQYKANKSRANGLYIL